MPELTNEQLLLVVVAVAGVALLSVLVALASMARLRKVRREYAVLRGDGGERDLIATMDRILRKLTGMEGRMDQFAARQEELTMVTRFSVRRFDLLRYDAFQDMGGQMSFSAAFLDDHGDGVVLTSINGRGETRTYAKPVKGLDSDVALTDEEREVIAGAAAGRGRGEQRRAALR